MKRENKVVTYFLWSFIVLGVLVCMFCLVTSTFAFTYKQLIFNEAYTKAAGTLTEWLKNLSNNASDNTENNMPSEAENPIVSDTINHLAQLQELQKNAASNDVMSFIYSVLSTILVGVCLGFVVRSHDSAKEAKTAAIESKKYMTRVKKDVTIAKDYATKAKDDASVAKEDTTNTNNLAKEIIDRLQKIEGDQKAYYRFLSFQSVQVSILLAREELHLLAACEIINERIKAVYNEVINLSSELNPNYIMQLLQTDLELLRKDVVVYSENVEKLPEHSDRNTRLVAVDWYNEKLNEAIAHCGKLLENRNSTS